MVTAVPSNPKRADLASATYSLAELATLLGVGYTTAHELALRDALPVHPIRVGRLYRFAKADVDRLLGVREGSADVAA
jgi:excisionase family DNA binding protein